MERAFWQEIAENDYKLPDSYNARDLLPDLFAFLASPDPVLRDDIGYMAFVYWITRDKHFSADELRDLMKTLTENLSHESVLLRSFSVLVLSVIAYYDVQAPFLETSEVADLLATSLRYLNAETDLRGYVEGSGWHHATAHTADVLKFLCRNPKMDTKQHELVLNAIFERLTMPVDTIYIHNEDERLTLAIIDIMRRVTIPVDVWEKWLNDFSNWRETHTHKDGFSSKVHAPSMNCKTFLRSLYFALKALIASEENELSDIQKLAKDMLPLLDKTLKNFAS